MPITISCPICFGVCESHQITNKRQFSPFSSSISVSMTPPTKTRKIVIKIPRHPYIMPQRNSSYEEYDQLRKCRVNLERLKGQNGTVGRPFPLKPKPKRCCVRVARLPNVERSEISVTPASSIVCSDFDDGKSSRKRNNETKINILFYSIHRLQV